MTRYTVTASPVDDLDRHPPLFTFNVTAGSTSEAVDLAGRLLGTKAPGLGVRSVVPQDGPLAGRTITPRYVLGRQAGKSRPPGEVLADEPEPEPARLAVPVKCRTGRCAKRDTWTRNPSGVCDRHRGPWVQS